MKKVPLAKGCPMLTMVFYPPLQTSTSATSTSSSFAAISQSATTSVEPQTASISTTAHPSDQPSGQTSLSAGASAGIGVGAAVGLLLLGLLGWLAFTRKRTRGQREKPMANHTEMGDDGLCHTQAESADRPKAYPGQHAKELPTGILIAAELGDSSSRRVELE